MGPVLGPIALMWIALLMSILFVVDTPSLRVWMAVIGGVTTISLGLRTWWDRRKARTS